MTTPHQGNGCGVQQLLNNKRADVASGTCKGCGHYTMLLAAAVVLCYEWQTHYHQRATKFAISAVLSGTRPCPAHELDVMAAQKRAGGWEICSGWLLLCMVYILAAEELQAIPLSRLLAQQ